ncbi:MAG: seryl-tRNA synthetase [Actinomycetota bacterium]|jgi:seryl-tRNA synthetase|nr:seryl-tRNA synthetase [Actinomycetota bacterium]
MLDIKAIREHPDTYRTGLARRNLADAVDKLLAADEQRRSLTAKVEELRARQNAASKKIGGAQGEEKQELIAEVGKVSNELKELEPQLAEAESSLNALLAATPNLPHQSSPDGFTDEDAVEISRNHDKPPVFDFEVLDHVALGEGLGVLDIDRAVRTSGSRFVYVMGDLVFLQFALVRHALDILTLKGFMPVLPPVLVREEAMYGTGFLPADEEQLYVTREDDLYLVGTAEVPLAAIHMNEILPESDLPARYAGYSSCFRREAGTYGKDMGGMFRVHQFDKVEMFCFTTPETSWDEHEFILSVEEEIMNNLEIPYRVVNIAAGDLGAPASKKYDIEGWLPAQGRYRELTSCSNTTDYQARRLGARVRRTAGGIDTLHTLNGTATALGRTMIAILENHQQADGSVVLPEKLHPYLPERARVLTPKA